MLKDLVEALDLADWAEIIVGLAIVAVTALVSYFVVRRLIVPVVQRLVLKTEKAWDDIFLDKAVLRRMALLAPVLASIGAADAVNGLVSPGAQANKKPEARQQTDLDSYRGTN